MRVGSIFRAGSIYTLGSTLQVAAAAAAVPAISRLLEPAQYGLVAVAVVLQTVVGTIVTLGLPAAITRGYFEPDADGGENGEAHAVMRLVSSAALLALAGVTAFAVSALFWGRGLAGGDFEAVLFGVGLALPYSILVCSQALLIVERRPWSFIAVALTASAGAQICGIVTVLLTSGRAVNYLAGVFAALVLASVIGLVRCGAARSRPAGFASVRRALVLGGPTVPHLLGVYVIALGDRIVIQSISGSAAVGRYQIAYALGGLAQTLLMGLQNAWLPNTFAAHPDVRWEELARTSELVVRLAAILVGALALAAPVGLRILAPSSYELESLIPVTALIACAAVPWSAYLPLVQVLLWQKRTAPLLWISPTAAAVNLLAAALLIPPFGLVGAALATLGAIALQAALAARAVKASVDIPWRRLGTAKAFGFAMVLVSLAIVLPVGLGGMVARGVLLAGLAVSAHRLIRAHGAD